MITSADAYFVSAWLCTIWTKPTSILFNKLRRDITANEPHQSRSWETLIGSWCQHIKFIWLRHICLNGALSSTVTKPHSVLTQKSSVLISVIVRRRFLQNRNRKQSLSSIAALTTAALRHRKPALAGTSCDSWVDQWHDRTNAMYIFEGRRCDIIHCEYIFTKNNYRFFFSAGDSFISLVLCSNNANRSASWILNALRTLTAFHHRVFQDIPCSTLGRNTNCPIFVWFLSSPSGQYRDNTSKYWRTKPSV
jgi:hypothetical protein